MIIPRGLVVQQTKVDPLYKIPTPNDIPRICDFLGWRMTIINLYGSLGWLPNLWLCSHARTKLEFRTMSNVIYLRHWNKYWVLLQCFQCPNVWRSFQIRNQIDGHSRSLLSVSWIQWKFPQTHYTALGLFDHFLKGEAMNLGLVKPWCNWWCISPTCHACCPIHWLA